MSRNRRDELCGLLSVPCKKRKQASNSCDSPEADRFYCPYPGCKRSFAELWRLKVHYRARPEVRGSGRERGHGTELAACPKCSQALFTGKHHVRAQLMKGFRYFSWQNFENGSVRSLPVAGSLPSPSRADQPCRVWPARGAGHTRLNWNRRYEQRPTWLAQSRALTSSLGLLEQWTSNYSACTVFRILSLGHWPSALGSPGSSLVIKVHQTWHAPGQGTDWSATAGAFAAAGIPNSFLSKTRQRLCPQHLDTTSASRPASAL